MDTGPLDVNAPNWDRSDTDVRYHILGLSTAVHGIDVAGPGLATDRGYIQDVQGLGKTLTLVLCEIAETQFVNPLLDSMVGGSPPQAAELLHFLDELTAALPPEDLFQRLTPPRD